MTRSAGGAGVGRAPQTLAAARIQGHSHRVASPPIPCQDSVLARFVGGAGAVLAVADGVSSSPLSEHGARFATEAVGHEAPRFVDALAKRRFTGKHAISLAEAVQNRWTRAVDDYLVSTEQSPGSNLCRDFACTLTIAVLFNKTVAVIGIGDGFVAASRRIAGTETKSYHLLLNQDRHGPFATHTATLADHDWRSHVRWCVLSDDHLSSIFVSSDGLEHVLLDDHRFRVGADEFETRVLGVNTGLLIVLDNLMSIADRPVDFKAALEKYPECVDAAGKGDDIGIAAVSW